MVRRFVHQSADLPNDLQTFRSLGHGTSWCLRHLPYISLQLGMEAEVMPISIPRSSSCSLLRWLVGRPRCIPHPLCLRWAASRVSNHLKILSASLFEQHAGASQHKPCTDVASGSLDSNTCRFHGVVDYEKPRAWDDALRKRKLIPENKKSWQKTALILGGTTKTIVDPRRDYNYGHLCIDRRIPGPYQLHAH